MYPHDAEDIKAHKWFRDIPWDHLHLITPPFVPRIASVDDTHYFDEEEPISDWSDSDSEDDDDDDTGSEASAGAPPHPPLEMNPLAMHAAGVAVPAANLGNMSPFTPPVPGGAAGGIIHNGHASTAIRRSPQKTAAMQAKLETFPRHFRSILAQFIATPYDSTRLKRMDREINALTATTSSNNNKNNDSNGNNKNSTSISPSQPQQPQKFSNTAVQFQEVDLGDQMKAFIRTFGQRERKRPRDRLLRDRKTKATVLRVRKQTAFLGYTFRRVVDGANDDGDDLQHQHAHHLNSVANNNSKDIRHGNTNDSMAIVLSTFDGVERMPGSRVYLRPEGGVGVESGGLEVVQLPPVAMPPGGTHCQGVSVVADSAIPGDAMRTAVYPALPHKPAMVNIGR